MCPTVPSAWSGRDSRGACPLTGPVWVFGCDFSITCYSVTWPALLSRGMSGSGSGQPGVTEGLQRSLTGKHSWRQAAGLSMGVLTSPVLKDCDIHHSACTGKRRGNSCESKEYGTPSQSMLEVQDCAKLGGKEGFSSIPWCLKWLERSVKFGLNQGAGSQKKQRDAIEVNTTTVTKLVTVRRIVWNIK